MTADRDSCIENFIQIWEASAKGIPKSMRREDPKVLIRLLQRIESGDNIFQVELKSKLDVKQSRLSKLMRKLEVPVDRKSRSQLTTVGGGGRFCLLGKTRLGKT